MSLRLHIGTTDDFILARINARRDFSKFKNLDLVFSPQWRMNARASTAGTVLAHAGAVAYNSRRPCAAGHGTTVVQSVDENL
ncbi:hypothetical protein [Paraburkholderia sp. HP33-1]|uniref:hypothetical protein n=1 Tax=Paraburkholderia sp. HP33-1 TaxID=2883243 RepID=UPI001F200A3B|nr:hypothetical protein [Paraburkholderia sp. HP33-1]